MRAMAFGVDILGPRELRNEVRYFIGEGFILKSDR